MINICVLYNTSSLARHVLIWYFLRVSSFSSGWVFPQILNAASRLNAVTWRFVDGRRRRKMAARWSSENVVVEFRDAQVFVSDSSGVNKVTDRWPGDPVNRWTGEQVKRLWQSETVRIVNSPSFTLRYWVQVKFCSVSRDDLWSVFISDELLTWLIWHQVRSGPVRSGPESERRSREENKLVND